MGTGVHPPPQAKPGGGQGQGGAGGRPYRGARKPGGPVPPRHSRKACGAWDVGAVHPKAAWLSGQAWDAGGPRGAGEASRALDTEKRRMVVARGTRRGTALTPTSTWAPPPPPPPPQGPHAQDTHSETLQVTAEPGPLHVNEGLREGAHGHVTGGPGPSTRPSPRPRPVGWGLDPAGCSSRALPTAHSWEVYGEKP